MDASLNTTPTTEAHRTVADVMKKRKSEGYDNPTDKNIHLKQAGNQREEAQLATVKQVMTNSHLSLAEM